ncbi:MAG TPA: hypothetical protein V6C81_14255 [Planktothrix sp.]|jgi:hypothetical protein
MPKIVFHKKERLSAGAAYPLEGAAIEQLLQGTPQRAMDVHYWAADYNWRIPKKTGNTRAPWILRAEFKIEDQPPWTISIFAVAKQNLERIQTALTKEALPELKKWLCKYADAEDFAPASHGGLNISLSICFGEEGLVYERGGFGY